MPDSLSPGANYAAVRESISELVRTLGPHQLSAEVPSCPGWTVHDVVAHLAGVATDAVNGVTPGESLDEWTAVQIADRTDTPTNVVLREWERSSSQFEVLLDKGPHELPPQLMDVVVHEDDIRHAVGVPRTSRRDLHGQIEWALISRWIDAVDRAGLDPLLVVVPTGDPYEGELNSPVVVRASPSFLARAAMGRRSRAQIAENFKNGRPTDRQIDKYIDLLCIFAPSASDLTS